MSGFDGMTALETVSASMLVVRERLRQGTKTASAGIEMPRRLGAVMSRTCAAPECGDGVINGNETCVETELCNVDCTLAECGDGIANTAFSEACDGDGLGTGGETALCDTDCTVAECGDGLVNATARTIPGGQGLKF